MTDKGPYELIRQAKEARRVTGELFLVVFLIGILLGILSSFIYSFLNTLPYISQLIIIASSLVLTGCLAWKSLDTLYFRHIREEKPIKIIIPLLSTTDHLMARKIKGYDVTRVANVITKQVFRRKENEGDRSRIKEEFGQYTNPVQFQPSPTFLWHVTMSLVQLLFMHYLGKAGDDSLGPSAPYHDVYFPVLNPEKKKASLDESFKKNYFYEKSAVFKGGKVLTPFSASPGTMSDREWFNIALYLKYGNIFFEVSPYLSRARGAKTLRTAGRRIEAEEGIGGGQGFTYLVEVNAKIKGEVKGFWIFKKECREFADWVTFLFDYLERHMDWEKYLEGETHRTLVDIDRKLKDSTSSISV